MNPDDYSYADGPGKYAGNMYRRAAAYVHNMTLNGFAAEECGTVEYGPGWHGLVYLDLEAQDDVVALGWQPDTDAAPEAKPVAAIVREDSQGFVDVTFYDSEESAQADWAEIQGEYDELEGEEE